MLKYINITISAILLLSACTKSEVQYEASAEIGFAPAAKNVTKAVMQGTLADNVHLGVWAYWNGSNGQVQSNVNDYGTYSSPFLANAEFAKKGTSWAGYPDSYLWPNTGALVFAGYTKTQVHTDMTVGVDEATYNLQTNTMTLDYSLYPQLKYSFDLCWFGRTAASYNNREDGDPVDVTMHHALTWLTIKVKGDATTAPADEAKKWRVTDMIIKDAYKQAVGTCTIDSDGDATAIWKLIEGQITHVNLGKTNGDDYTETNLSCPLTQEAQAYEAVENAVIVIPQPPLKLEVTYECPTAGGGYTQKTAEVDLTLTGHKDADGNDIDANERIDMWEAGKHYTYTLVFKANEILVAPSFGAWDTTDQTITVE